MRRAAKVDATQQAIVKALRDAGAYVYVIGLPVDLLTCYRGRWAVLECKSVGSRPRADRAAQTAFVERYRVPVVRTPEEALDAIGVPFEVKFSNGSYTRVPIFLRDQAE